MQEQQRLKDRPHTEDEQQVATDKAQTKNEGNANEVEETDKENQENETNKVEHQEDRSTIHSTSSTSPRKNFFESFVERFKDFLKNAE